METIETRLGNLERHNRIYRNLFILAGLALVAAVSYGATKPVPEVIRARAFHVVREDGQVVSALEPFTSTELQPLSARKSCVE